MNQASSKIDFLPLQWYEVNRTVIKRKTLGGVEISLKRPAFTPIKDGETLIQEGNIAIKSRIEPCLCIVLNTTDIEMIGSFCFDVGNRHLPIFKIDDKFIVSYDGHLFQALSIKYGTFVSVEEYVLKIDNALKTFGNYY